MRDIDTNNQIRHRAPIHSTQEKHHDEENNHPGATPKNNNENENIMKQKKTSAAYTNPYKRDTHFSLKIIQRKSAIIYLIIILFLLRFLIVPYIIHPSYTNLKCNYNLCQWSNTEIISFDSDIIVGEEEPNMLNVISKAKYRDISDAIIYTDIFPESSACYVKEFKYSRSYRNFLRFGKDWETCLPPVPLFYYFNDGYDHVKQRLVQSGLDSYPAPFMMISPSHALNPSENPEVKQILDNPNLLHWYTTNIEEHHPKMVAIPLGILIESNLMHAPYIFEAYTELEKNRRKSLLDETNDNNLGRPNLILVNFSTDNPIKSQWRKAPRDHFCAFPEATCTSGGFFDNRYKDEQSGVKKSWESQAKDTYLVWGQHKYTVCPRGEKLDSFRVWESLYIGSIPIIMHSTNDESIFNTFGTFNYEELPVLFVDNFEDVTIELLEYLWKHRFYNMMKNLEWRKRLNINWIKLHIAKARHDILSEDYSSSKRNKCWGKSDTLWYKIKQAILGF